MPFHFLDGIYLLDKATQIPCQHFLNILKRKLKQKKIGHLGTLDPFASGVLPVFVGEATKLIPYLEDSPKVYEATLSLGQKTDTLDLSGNVIEEKKIPLLSCEQIEKAMQTFIGEQWQTPPQYSAIKIKGQAAYRLAREGKEVELAKRKVRIDQIELQCFEDSQIRFKTTVSKGTYIRSLALDLAVKLNTVGHLTKLRRLQSGVFRIEDANIIESFDDSFPEKIADKKMNIEKLIPFKSLQLNEKQKEDLKLGRWLECSEAEGHYFAKFENEFFGIAEVMMVNEKKILKIKRGLELS